MEGMLTGDEGLLECYGVNMLGEGIGKLGIGRDPMERNLTPINCLARSTKLDHQTLFGYR